MGKCDTAINVKIDNDLLSKTNPIKVSEAMFKKGICLPSPTKSTNGELMRVVEVIKNVCY